MHYKLYLHHRTTYKYMPFLEVPRQLCSTPQSKDTQTPHSVYCCCWQDKEGRCHSVLDTSQGHNLPRGGRYNKSERKTDRDWQHTDWRHTHARATIRAWLKSWATHTPVADIQTPNSILWTHASWPCSSLWMCIFNTFSNHLNQCSSTNDRCYCLWASYQTRGHCRTHIVKH